MNRIRELRKQRDMTQKDLAKILEIADSTLSYWEMGRYEPDYESLWKLSRLFRVPIDYILGGSIEEWISGWNRTLYTEAVKRARSDSGFMVSESKALYGVADSGETETDDMDELVAELSSRLKTELGRLPAVFDRSEFAGLTPAEIEKLAEYAEFLKSRRGN